MMNHNDLLLLDEQLTACLNISNRLLHAEGADSRDLAEAKLRLALAVGILSGFAPASGNRLSSQLLPELALTDSAEELSLMSSQIFSIAYGELNARQYA